MIIAKKPLELIDRRFKQMPIIRCAIQTEKLKMLDKPQGEKVGGGKNKISDPTAERALREIQLLKPITKVNITTLSGKDIVVNDPELWSELYNHVKASLAKKENKTHYTIFVSRFEKREKPVITVAYLGLGSRQTYYNYLTDIWQYSALIAVKNDMIDIA